MMVKQAAPWVIKISGHELDCPAVVEQLAGVVKTLGRPVVIVHGGGKEISALQTQLGITPQYIDGQRVTDALSLAIVEMVLCGVINKRLVRTFVSAGVDAQGLSGVDRGFIRAQKLQHPAGDFGFTGQVTAVRVEVLTDLLALGSTPVIAPVCLGNGHNYNVNADLVAGAVAVALDADRLIFLSNVPGVLHEGTVIDRLTPGAVETLIAEGVISGGMIPKVQAAVTALRAGVRQAAITHLAGLAASGGTVFSQ